MFSAFRFLVVLAFRVLAPAYLALGFQGSCFGLCVVGFLRPVGFRHLYAS